MESGHALQKLMTYTELNKELRKRLHQRKQLAAHAARVEERINRLIQKCSKICKHGALQLYMVNFKQGSPEYGCYACDAKRASK